MWLGRYLATKGRMKSIKWRPHLHPLKYVSKSGKKIKKKTSTSRIFSDTVSDFLYRINYGTYQSFMNKKTRNRGKKHVRIRMGLYRTVKSYPIYKLIREDNTFFKIIKRATLSEFKQHYKINKTNRVVGWTPDYVGITKSRYIKKQNYLLRSLSKVYKKNSYLFSNEFNKQLLLSLKDERVVYSSGFDACHHHLAECFKDNSPEMLPHSEIISILEKSNYKFFYCNNNDFSNSDELYSMVRVNPNSYSGHYTSKIFGNKKFESEYENRWVAERMWRRMKEAPVKNLYLWTVLGREKDIKVNDINTEVGNRAILCCESAPTTLLMWFSQIISLKLNNCHYPNKTFNVISSFDGEKMKYLKDKEDFYDYKLNGDWSLFDSNQDTNIQEVAGALLVSGFKQDKHHYNISYFIISSIVQKYVLLPPGVVVELNRAMPSGHPFTTTINCIINTIYWCIIGYKIYGDDYAENMDFEVYGDDSVVYFKKHKNIFRIDEIVKEIGLKSDPLINNLRICNFKYDESEEIDFLKRRLNNDVITWNHKKIIDRIIYQTKNRCIDDQIELLYNYYITCPNDEQLFYLCKIIFNDILDNYYNEVNDENAKAILNDPVWNSNFNIDNTSSKDKYYHKNDTLIDIWYKYLNIYSYRKVLSKREFIIKKFNYKSKFVRQSLMLLFGMHVKELNQLRYYDFKKYGRDPPCINVNYIQRAVDRYYEKELSTYSKIPFNPF